MNANSPPSVDMALSVEDALRLLDALNRAAANPPTTDAGSLPPQTSEIAKTGNDAHDLAQTVSHDLRDLAITVLKIELEDFSFSTPLMNYGLDSIAATEIGTLFTAKFGITVPPTAFFEFQDIDSFTNYLLANHEPELRARYGVTPKDIASPATPRSPVPDPMPVPAAAIPSLEDLWRDIEVPAVAAPGAASPPIAAVATQTVGEPSPDVLRAAQALVDAAHVLTIRRNGAPALECAVSGDGPPVLLLGGLVMHYSVMWRLQLTELGAHYRLIMVHMPGCGGADLYEALSLDSLACDVATVLDALGIAAPVPVIGYSFGGVLAQAFCLAYP
ncbi:MAG: alpha/beta fold hydrolase, partial [Beijerinckiaceae bacterium]|nr:alpha/beta fold hydrolase [Beijerinckiaceae bacterium]